MGKMTFNLNKEVELGVGHLSNVFKKELKESNGEYSHLDKVVKIFSRLVMLYGLEGSDDEPDYVYLLDTRLELLYKEYREILNKYGIKYKIKEDEENKKYVIVLVRDENTKWV